MKKYGFIALIISAVFTPLLFAMNQNDDHIVVQQEHNDSYKGQTCLDCIPKRFFGNKECYDCRKVTSNVGFTIGTVITALKFCGTFEAFCCFNVPCNDSLSCPWIGPSIHQYCNSPSDCAYQTCALSTTILAGGGCLTGICAWNPLCTQEGCNPALKCRKKENSNIQMITISSDNNDDL